MAFQPRRSLSAALRPLALLPGVSARGLGSACVPYFIVGGVSGDQAYEAKEEIRRSGHPFHRRLLFVDSQSTLGEREKPLLYRQPLSLFPLTAVRNRKWGPFYPVRCEATVAEKEVTDASVETFEYQAEVSRLLDLIVHSLYSHKEVFLRELVSNASDALDKLRFLSVTDPSLLSGGSDLEIKIKTDSELGTLTIIDTGIGMTKEELIKSLGTIAESGTAKFLKALKENKDTMAGDNNLIGQFGVGFYASFLVAQKVAVSTKSPKSDKQFVWEGEADSGIFAVHEETDPEKLLTRGTSITLFLKEDAKVEYSNSTKILSLVKNYSEYISFPIHLQQEKTREVEVVDDVDPKDIKGQADTSSKEKKKTKKITEKYFEWELVNSIKPIWMRSPKEVSKNEYEDFYKKTFNERLEPMTYSHFSTEGEVEFKTLFYIPKIAPFNSDEASKMKNIRLLVKRVFISDEFDGELFPRYLCFIKGVVDSNDLPLNVSREILQESRVVRTMKKRLVKKAFDMIEEIAKRDSKEDYNNFWRNFGKNIKLGCLEDEANHKHLLPLLRFYSSKHEDDMTTLKAYVDTMKKDQKVIYYLAAETIQSAQSSPFLEELTNRGLEVLFLVEPIDEMVFNKLQSFKEKKFQDISKEDIDLGSEDETKHKELRKKFSRLCKWMKQQLGDRVAKVQLSKRLNSTPCVLVSPDFGWSANMERIVRAQTLGDAASAVDFARGSRILEINPNHPMLRDLNDVSKDGSESICAKRTVELLYETAVLSSGFALENPATYAMQVFEMMATAISKRREGQLDGIYEPADAYDEPAGVHDESAGEYDESADAYDEPAAGYKEPFTASYDEMEEDLLESEMSMQGNAGAEDAEPLEKRAE